MKYPSLRRACGARLSQPTPPTRRERSASGIGANERGREAMKPIASIVLIIVLFTIPIAGCAGIGETIEQTSRWRDQAHNARNTAESELEDLVDQREAFPDSSQQAGLIDAAIARARAKISMLDAAIVHADMVLEETENPTDGLTGITERLISFIPAPAQGPLLLGAALITTLVRSQQLKAGSRSIIQSIQHAVSNDESFHAAFKANADTIRTIQTPLARRMVDKVQRG